MERIWQFFFSQVHRWQWEFWFCREPHSIRGVSEECVCGRVRTDNLIDWLLFIFLGWIGRFWTWTFCSFLILKDPHMVWNQVWYLILSSGGWMFFMLLQSFTFLQKGDNFTTSTVAGNTWQVSVVDLFWGIPTAEYIWYYSSQFSITPRYQIYSWFSLTYTSTVW